MKKIAEITDKNTVTVYDKTQFDADAIMHSGQVFRYFKTDGGYKIISGGESAEVFTLENSVIIKTGNPRYFFEYFDLNTDYNEIKNSLSGFIRLQNAVKLGGGIRILRADFFETVISFIISANNNIKRFTKTLNLLSKAFGKDLGGGLYAFPDADALLNLSDADYGSFGCGYRSPYLYKTVRLLKNFDPDGLKTLSNAETVKKLTALSGVGPKVAACIMLFSLHRLDSVPIDTWILKALDSFNDTEKALLLSHPFGGVAQQYIYYYIQHLKQEL